MNSIWDACIQHLESVLSTQELNMWIRPLHAIRQNRKIILLAPNSFVFEEVRERFYNLILETLKNQNSDEDFSSVEIIIGTKSENGVIEKKVQKKTIREIIEKDLPEHEIYESNLSSVFTFEKFIQGKSNQLARAAAYQVGINPGSAYNPLYIYGGTGLGKTHIMHAVGNLIKTDNVDAKIVYIHSERFVDDMIKSLQHNAIDEFKRYYRSVNALLIDDIQFFAGKERSQEEFFHTFNVLLERKQQVILTCDRYPKEVEGLEDRLKSRFGQGLTVMIEPPDLETRVAILMSKADQFGIHISNDVAFFICKKIRANVRELEGALRRVIAFRNFRGDVNISIDFVKEALSDMMKQDLLTIDYIQKTVAEYFRIRPIDIKSKKRNRTIARPRQIAMALTKELTSHSLPEIGEAFGGKDHTTVMHACKKVKELQQLDKIILDDYKNLLRILVK